MNSTVDDNEFWAARGIAIQAYAEVEHAMFHVYHGLGRQDHKIAAPFFYGMRSGHIDLINRIIELRPDLASKWEPLKTKITMLSPLRNAIVHWYVIESAPGLEKFRIFPPNFPNNSTAAERKIGPITTAMMHKFIKDCNVARDKVHKFARKLWFTEP